MKKYHKPVIRTEKAFDVKTDAGITATCYCNSWGASKTTCDSGSHDGSGI